MHRWQDDLAEVRARYDALGPADLASATEPACEWRLADPFSGFFLPLPPVAQELFSAHGNWRTEIDNPHERCDAVAFDASGRPVVHVLERDFEFERPNHLWWWDDDGSFLEVELMGSGPHVRRARMIDGRPAHVATFSAGGEDSVQILTSRDGRVVRSDAARVSEYGGQAGARTAEFDGEGALLRIRETRADGAGRSRGVPRAGGSTGAGRDRLGSPGARAGAVAGERGRARAGRALGGGARRRAAGRRGRLGRSRPVLVGGVHGRAPRCAVPPVAHLHDARWRDRMRRSSSRDGAALFESYRAAEAGLAPDIRTDRSLG